MVTLKEVLKEGMNLNELKGNIEIYTTINLETMSIDGNIDKLKEVKNSIKKLKEILERIDNFLNNKKLIIEAFSNDVINLDIQHKTININKGIGFIGIECFSKNIYIYRPENYSIRDTILYLNKLDKEIDKVIYELSN